MGLDMGTKTIGVAVSDPLGLTAQGIAVIRRHNWDKDMKELQKVIDEYGVEKILIGLPRRTTGELGPEAEKVHKEGRKLEAALGLPVMYWNEWFSTSSAEQVLLAADMSRQRRRQVIDQVAAAIILQSYLDSTVYQGRGDGEDTL